MLFNSLFFLFVFLPASLAVYYLLGLSHETAAKWWLAFLSLFFYGWWSPVFLILLVASILFNYACGYAMQVLGNRPRTCSWILALGVTANLGALFYYKYLLALLSWFHDRALYAGPLWGSLILPLGISFFTFTQIGFLIDVRDGAAKERGFLEYLLFVTFFPHLIAGPILHHREMMPQFAEKQTYRLRWDNIAIGLSIFVLGLAKKVLLADPLSAIAADVFRNTGEKHLLEAWAGVACYSLQLYFDFAGYSEMALGLARMFNILFPANFDSPYKSRSIIDFWQRWHISLTRYLTLYLYNPISLWIIRRRAAQGKSLLRPGDVTAEGFLKMLAGPTLVTMTLVGIWHGAGLQFMIFGLLHGLYLCVNHLWRWFGPKKTASSPVLRGLDGLWKWALTYAAVLVSFVFFRAKNLQDAWGLIQSLAGRGTGDSLGGLSGPVESALDYLGITVPYWNFTNCWLSLVVGMAIILFFPNVLQLFDAEKTSLTKIKAGKPVLSFVWRNNWGWALTLALLASVTLLMITGNSEFLYFKF